MLQQTNNHFISEIKQILSAARQRAYSAVNSASYNKMVCFYAQKEDNNWYYVEIGLYE